MKDAPITINGLEEVLGILEQAKKSAAQVKVLLPGSDNTFSTNFENSSESVSNDTSSLAGKLYLEPLLPTNGNILIRRCKKVKLRFPLGESMYECQVPFQGVISKHGYKLIQLGNPPLIERYSAKRKHTRVRIEPDCEIGMSVILPTGETLKTTIFDLSAGGVAFHYTGEQPSLGKDTQIQLQLELPNQLTINIAGSVIDVRTKEGKHSYQVKMLRDRPQLAKHMEEIISLITTEQSRRRKRKFSIK
jgi:c-di-GMP-binding flagellar brake protein YcgR